MLRYANPKRFMDLSGHVLPWLGTGAAILLGFGLYLGFAAPPDYQQGDTVKIMFVHVPAAWVAMMTYGLIALCAAIGLINRHPLADAAAKAAAPLGALFTALALITGSLWGKPMWGAWWVWDGRLTSFLILLFLYLGYIALWNAIEDETRAARASCDLGAGGRGEPSDHRVLGSSGGRRLHQGESILRPGGPTISAVFLWPLFAMALGYTLLFFTLWIVRIRTEILNRRARNAACRGSRERLLRHGRLCRLRLARLWCQCARHHRRRGFVLAQLCRCKGAFGQARKERAMKRLIYILPVLAFAGAGSHSFLSTVAAQTARRASLRADRQARAVAQPARAGCPDPGLSIRVTSPLATSRWSISSPPGARPAARKRLRWRSFPPTRTCACYGLVYQGQSPNRARLSRRNRQSFRAHRVDADGRAGIEWGVYGVPETFVIDGRGIVRARIVGALTDGDKYTRELLPAIAAAKS